MMRKIKTEDIKIGMVFSMPVFFDDGKNRLLGKLSPVTEQELSILKRWKIPFVVTEGSPMKKNKNMMLYELVDDYFNAHEYHFEETITEEENQNDTDILMLPETDTNIQVYTQYNEIIQEIDVFFSDFQKKKPVKRRPLDALAFKLCEMIEQSRNIALLFILSVEIPGKQYAKASVDTAILVYMMIQTFELSPEHITDTVIAALLHNCGMLRIPQSIIEKKGDRTENEQKLFSAYPIYGYKAALSEFLYEQRIASAILQSHERWDGKGYPSGLAKEKISVGARLIAVADTFITMINRKRLSGYNAMRVLIADKGQRFDYTIVKILLRCLGAYPVGSIVRLSDDSIARVIAANPKKPLSPRIRILSANDGKIFPYDTGLAVDLAAQNTLSILSEVQFPLKHYHV